MKNLLFSPFTLMLISFLSFSTPSFGGEKDSLYTIEVSGKVLIPETDESKFYKLELLCDNIVLETGIVVDSECFLLRVKKNSLYTIRIIKEGYFPLVVSLNTYISESDRQKYQFDNPYFMTLHGFQLSLSMQEPPGGSY